MKNFSIPFLIIFALVYQVNAQKFSVSFSPEVLKDNFSGNIILYLSKENKSPKDISVGLELTPVFRIEVEKLAGGQEVVFDDNAISYPVALTDIERGKYYAQVVFDLNQGDFNIGSSAGNIYSIPVNVSLTKDFNQVFKIVADKTIDPVVFKETGFLKELSVKSQLLSDFNKKDVYVNGAVALPEDYFSNPEAKYPVVFSIFGFGANYKIHSGLGKYKFTHLNDQPVIVVYLDGNCPEGHSTYANSDVNGPWGDALVKEFIPALTKKYRTNGANLLFGHSSGGWSTLWLQINYPKVFVGTWSSSPDQVDFRNYQNKNIYEEKNMFYDENGSLYFDVTIAGRLPVISAKDFYRTEDVIYRGSQMHSFDAVFGGFDKDGKRIRLVKLPGGEINPAALPLWKRYDISNLLRQSWDQLKNDLNGKMRISVGEGDNFYLNHPVHLLETEMKKLGANIEFEYFAGDHFTVFTAEYQKKGLAFLEQCYETWSASK
jgi:hypothetical protein